MKFTKEEKEKAKDAVEFGTPFMTHLLFDAPRAMLMLEMQPIKEEIKMSIYFTHCIGNAVFTAHKRGEISGEALGAIKNIAHVESLKNLDMFDKAGKEIEDMPKNGEEELKNTEDR